MISARKLRLLRRIAGTTALAAITAVLVVIYLRSEGTGVLPPVRSAASSPTGGDQRPSSQTSSGSSGGSKGSGSGACPPPRLCASQTSGTGSSSGARASAKVTYTGPVAENPYGPVQVAVVEEGGKIVDVKPLQMPTEHALSQEISEQVAPMLRAETLQAQSAEVNVISGATYTSESYASSLQGALQKAG